MPKKKIEASDLVVEASTSSAIGFDLDGTIDENANFFGVLSKFWPGKVYVVTHRSDAVKAKNDVDSFGIRYDEIVLVQNYSEKAEAIKRLGIGIFFDDMDEVINCIPENVTVMKVRNGGNFEKGKWLYSKSTGKLV